MSKHSLIYPNRRSEELLEMFHLKRFLKYSVYSIIFYGLLFLILAIVKSLLKYVQSKRLTEDLIGIVNPVFLFIWGLAMLHYIVLFLYQVLNDIFEPYMLLMNLLDVTRFHILGFSVFGIAVGLLYSGNDGFFVGILVAFLWFLYLIVSVFLINKTRGLDSSDRIGSEVDEDLMTLEQSDVANDLGERYVAQNVLKLRENPDQLTIDNLDEKIQEMVLQDIKKFHDIILLHDIEVTSREALFRFLMNKTARLREMVRTGLRDHLTSQLLEDTDTNIEDIIDQLLNQYQNMETERLGKL